MEYPVPRIPESRNFSGIPSDYRMANSKMKTVYFMGAGATRAASDKAPLNRELVEKALGDCSETEEARELQEFLRKVYHRERPPANNQIWNLLDYLIQRGRTGSKDYSLEKIGDLRTSLIKLLINFFRERLAEADHKLFTQFIKVTPPGTTIISTNYDILLDNGFLDNEHCNYGAKIRKPIGRESVRMGGMDRPASDVFWGFFNRGDLLLKLHGSLNWLFCRRCDEVDIILRDKASEKDLGSLYCSNENCTNKYEPLLITPTMFKSYETRFVKEIWDIAGRELTLADELTFVGFALKEEDYHVRSLLMSSLLNRGGSYSKVTVIDKKNPVKDVNEETRRLDGISVEYRELYGDNITFRTDGFEAFVSEMMRVYGVS